MWPWEAPVFGYLCYTVYTRLRYRSRPEGWPVLVMAVGSIVPDLIDKPLHWQFGIFSSGYALGHSIFFGAFVTAVGYAWAKRRGVPRLGTAFGFGMVTHEIGAALEHVVAHGHLWFGIEHMLWPIYRVPSSSTAGFWPTTLHYLAEYLYAIVTLDPKPYLIMILAILAIVVPIWVYDGLPGLRELGVVLTYPFSRSRP